MNTKLKKSATLTIISYMILFTQQDQYKTYKQKRNLNKIKMKNLIGKFNCIEKQYQLADCLTKSGGSLYALLNILKTKSIEFF